MRGLTSLIRDERGNAFLIVSFIAALILAGILYIWLTPIVNDFFSIYNGWVLDGWVSQESWQTISIVKYAWIAIPFLVPIILAVIVIIRSYVLHDGGY